ncbi:MAG: hypothetical protein GEU73_10915 [Chloroflexi bacterium]|nr:hypothetical protein [Chloroflexota bacterium]
MAEPFIFITTYAIKEGKLEGYKQYLREFLKMIEAKEPRLIHFGVYINEDGTEVTNVQVHPDAKSMEYHLEVVADEVAKWPEFCDFSKMSIQVCGTPTDALLSGLTHAGPGVPLNVKTLHAGLTRLQPQPV